MYPTPSSASRPMVTKGVIGCRTYRVGRLHELNGVTIVRAARLGYRKPETHIRLPCASSSAPMWDCAAHAEKDTQEAGSE